MFSKMTNLVSQLSLTDNGNYKQAKEARKVLQEIKKEAQSLRDQITNNFKESKKTPKVKSKSVEKREEIQKAESTTLDNEPKLVKEEDEDEDFFAK